MTQVPERSIAVQAARKGVGTAKIGMRTMGQPSNCTDPVLCGELFKLGDHIKTWRQRMFTISSMPVPTLAYYRTAEQKRPTQVLFLKGAKVQVVDVTGDTELFRFTVSDARANAYRLAASTAAARSEWISALKRAIMLTSPRTSPSGTPNGSSGSAGPSPGFNKLVQSHATGQESPTLSATLENSPRALAPPLEAANELQRMATASLGSAPSPNSASLAKRLSLTTQCKEWVRETFLGSPLRSQEASPFAESPLPEYVRPLKLRAPKDILLDMSQPDLPQASLVEHFERAQQYVARRRPSLTDGTMRALEGWQAMAEAFPGPPNASPQHLSAAAMFVMEVTKFDPNWASWSETDVASISPENMLEQLRQQPSLKVLEDLGLCLAYRSTTWLSVYCRLGGVAMQLEALRVHMEASVAGEEPEAADAVLAALQGLFTLKSTPAGVQAILDEGGSLIKLCGVLLVGDVEASKLVLDMLLHILIYSSKGYVMVLKTLMGARPVLELSQGTAVSTSAATASNLSKTTKADSTTKPVSAPTPPPARIPPPPPPPMLKAPPRKVPAAAPAPPAAPPPPLQQPRKAIGVNGKDAAAKPVLQLAAESSTAALKAPEADAMTKIAACKASSIAGKVPESASKANSAATEASYVIQCTPQPERDSSGLIAASTAPAAMQKAAEIEEKGISAAGEHSRGSTEVEAGPEFCTQLLGMLKGDIDVELASKVLTLILAALNAADASTHPDLRLQFLKMLLETGLLRSIAEVNNRGIPHISALSDTLLAHIREVMAPPKAAPKTPTKSTQLNVKPAPAPPPPPPSSSRPSAPPPPPGGKRGPPPPPPTGGRRGLFGAKPKVAPGPKPNKKLKRLFWDKVPDMRIPGTYWATHPPDYAVLRQHEVEEMFQAKVPVTSSKVGGKAQKKLAVLDIKRATAIGVQIRGLNCHWSKLKSAIAAFDHDVFKTRDDVIAVMKCLPTEQEQSLLESLITSGASLDNLTDAELVCIDLMQIARVRTRLETFLIKFEAHVLLSDANNYLSNHLAAQTELRASTCFAAVLVQVLTIGNFLNHGSGQGQAAGFRLQSLEKLDARSFDGNTTLLQYIAQRLCSQTPPLPPLSSQVPHTIKLFATLSETKEMIEKVAASVETVKDELAALPPPVKASILVVKDRVELVLELDSYQLVMLSIVEAFEADVKQARTLQQKADDNFRSLVCYFGENDKAIPADPTFWGPITKFVRFFTAAQNEVFKLQQEQEEKERRRLRKEASASATISSRSTNIPTRRSPPEAADIPSLINNRALRRPTIPSKAL